MDTSGLDTGVDFGVSRDDGLAEFGFDLEKKAGKWSEFGWWEGDERGDPFADPSAALRGGGLVDDRPVVGGISPNGDGTPGTLIRIDNEGGG